METERLIIEVVCAGLIILMSVVLCLVSNFSPILASMKGSSSLVQCVAFTCIPLSVYGVSRLLFTVWISGTNKVLDGEGLKKLPGVVQNWAGWLRSASAVLIMYLGVAAARIALPGLGEVASGLYNDYLGDLPEIIWTQTKGERERALGRGERVVYLVVAWFIFFLIFELMLRTLLMGVKFVLRIVFKPKNGVTGDGTASVVGTEREESKGKTSPSDSDDEPESISKGQ